MSSFTKPPTKSRHRWFIGVILGIILLGGVASFIFSAGNQETQQEEVEYQIVDITVPPPPPPPEEETMEEPEELEESIEPLEMAANSQASPEDSADLDLGIDIGDLAASTGSGFAMDIPRFGRGSLGGSDGEGALGEEMDTPASPVSKTPPTYPSSLLSKGIGGRVLVNCTVDDTGRVTGTSIKQSSGHPDLDKAAVNAVNKWKFKPATKAGRKLKTSCIVPFNFEVKKT
jgi:periplasmic protein TonB